MAEKVLLTEEDIRRALSRIAHEVVERNRGCQDLVFIGMRTRGVPLARRLAQLVNDFEGCSVPWGSLDIGLYRDDVASRGLKPQVRPTSIPDIEGRKVVLLDDVLYTGRSVRAALDALIDFGRPQSIQLAVLVDRGHRELPIRADYVGKNVPTSSDEDIRVRLTETDGCDEVALVQTGPEEAP